MDAFSDLSFFLGSNLSILISGILSCGHRFFGSLVVVVVVVVVVSFFSTSIPLFNQEVVLLVPVFECCVYIHT